MLSLGSAATTQTPRSLQQRRPLAFAIRYVAMRVQDFRKLAENSREFVCHLERNHAVSTAKEIMKLHNVLLLYVFSGHS